MIRLAGPVLRGRERQYIQECLDGNQLSGGAFVERFERAFAEFCGTRHAIACSNGTAALHLALKALGVGVGDEVIVPTLTFVATANAVAYCGADPVFVDAHPDYWCIDPEQIEARITERTRGIIAVHLYGHPADMAAIQEIANRRDLFVLEDAAEAHGAMVIDQRVGSIGEAGCFSFYGNKIITTGEGGMVVTDNGELAHWARKLRGHGYTPDRRYYFDAVGFNYRMTELQAAVGLGQVEDAKWHIARRRRVADWYMDRLAGYGLRWQKLQPWAEPVDWLMSIVIGESYRVSRDAVMDHLAERGIETRPFFVPMHKLPVYADDGLYPIADYLAERGLSLPTHAGLNEDDVDRVCAALLETIGQ